MDDPLELERCTRWRSNADGSRTAESFLQLSGMYCAACADTIEHALRSVDGVLAADVTAATQRATVRWDGGRVRFSELIDAVRRAGYEAVPDTAASARELRVREHRALLWRLFVASFCAMQVMMLATPSYVAAEGALAADMRQLLNWGGWVLTLPVMWFAAGPFLRSAWRQVGSRRIGMDVPVVLGILVTFVASMGATFDPKGIFGHEVYYDSLTMFLSFLLAGRYVEMRARHRAAADLEGALAELPETAVRLEPDGRWAEVSVRRLVAGDQVRVAVGQAFAADGVIVHGQSRAEEAMLTGESTPVPKQPGDGVVAGSINVGAPVVMRVERVGADTRYEAIVNLMRQALSERPAAARLADRWAQPFLWSVLLLAVGSAMVWALIDPPRAVWVAVSVLVVTCPCALSLATPTALVAAAGGLARRGVLFRRLDGIEALAGVQRLFVDKTGTLTADRPHLAGVHPAAGLDEPLPVLAIAASIAAWSRHPLSQAIVAANADGAGGLEWTLVQESAGRGLRALDQQGDEWRLGEWSWVGGQGPAPEAGQVHLARKGVVVATFGFEEKLRDGADQALAELRAMGIRLTLLSGDRMERARAVAERLGCEEVIAGARPEDKLARLAGAQAQGESVGMVGDGINDAPVLARADVSLAMGQGALVARANADAVIVSNRLADLVAARRVAVRTMGIVRQNLVWAMAYNAVSVPLAVAGWLPPWLAGLGMAASSLVVIGNSMRAAR